MSPSASKRFRRYVELLDARYGTLAQQVEEDVAESRAFTPREDDEAVASVCRSAMSILRSRPDFSEAMNETDPPAADFERIWARLMARHRP